MESIKIGNKTFELVANGYQLQQDGGRIVFQPGEVTFEEAEAAAAAATSIMLLDDAGDPSDHGTGTVSQSAESSMYGFVLSAVAASWTCVYYDPIGENNERNNCMDS